MVRDACLITFKQSNTGGPPFSYNSLFWMYFLLYLIIGELRSENLFKNKHK